jgi:hypothetical protein
MEGYRNKAGGPALAQDVATDYALRAAKLLGTIAKARGATVLDTRPAEQTLLNATTDPRPEVAKEVGNVLAWVDSPQVQPALAHVAGDEKTPPDVRVALYKALAANAKNFGNHLQGPQFAAIQTVVQKGDAPELRNSAAEAAGALKLPGDQAKRLILDWKVETATGGTAPAGGAPAAAPAAAEPAAPGAKEPAPAAEPKEEPKAEPKEEPKEEPKAEEPKAESTEPAKEEPAKEAAPAEDANK